MPIDVMASFDDMSESEALILAFWLVQTLDNVRISIQPLINFSSEVRQK